MDGTKITRPKDGCHKNNTPKERTDGESNGWLKNDLPKGWIKGELINSPNRNILDIRLKLVKNPFTGTETDRGRVSS